MMSKKDLEKSIQIILDSDYKEMENLRDTIADLAKQNRELQERINSYENPEDLTLMFMYCNEKAKDKIKELQNKIDKLEDELDWYKQESEEK